MNFLYWLLGAVILVALYVHPAGFVPTDQTLYLIAMMCLVRSSME